MSIEAEALLAAVGIDAVLAPGALRITAAQREKAAKWADGSFMGREVRRFLNAQDPEPNDLELPEFDYLETLDRLTAGVSPEEAADRISGEDAAVLVLVAGKAIDFLLGEIPKRTRVTPLGIRPVEPSDIELARFRVVYGAINDPARVFARLRAGVLSTAEMRAFAAVYPELNDLLRQIVFEALAELAAKRSERYELPHETAKSVATLLGVTVISREVLAEAQASFEGQDVGGEAPAPPKRPLKSGAERLETPVQRTTFK